MKAAEGESGKTHTYVRRIEAAGIKVEIVCLGRRISGSGSGRPVVGTTSGIIGAAVLIDGSTTKKIQGASYQSGIDSEAVSVGNGCFKPAGTEVHGCVFAAQRLTVLGDNSFAAIQEQVVLDYFEESESFEDFVSFEAESCFEVSDFFEECSDFEDFVSFEELEVSEASEVDFVSAEELVEEEAESGVEATM